MRRAILWFGISVGAAVVPTLLTWCYYGEIRFYFDLGAISVDENAKPRIVGTFPHGVCINTFDDDLESESIGRSYFRACRRLDAVRGSRPRRTYYWEDEITYPAVSSVVQYGSCYVEVTAYQGNDSDGASVTINPGQFLAKERAKLRELPTDELPPGTLRYQWR